MQPRRFSRDDDRNDSCEHLLPVLAAETSRSAANPPPKAESARSGEEKVSIFWRIFGGTILSIVALVVLTAYQSISGSIHELRSDLARLNESKSDLVKKDEWASSRTKIWDRLQESQKEQQALQAPLTQLQQRADKLEAENKTLIAERREMHELHATIKERLAQFEEQLKAGKLTQKDVQSLQQSVAGLQEKSAVRDQQLQSATEERKELAKEIQALRERLAKLEAAKEVAPAKPSVKTTSNPKPEDD